jgi:hypothetical protein
MASPFRQRIVSYRTPDGKKCTKDTPGAVKITTRTKDWYGQYRDAEGKTRRVPLCPDKAAAKQMLAKLITDAKMGRLGLTDPYSEHRKKRLSCPTCKASGKTEDGKECDQCNGAHLSAYRRYLETKGDSGDHVTLTIKRIDNIFENCRFTWLSDLNPGRVMEYLADRRKAGTAIGTSNHYLRAVKAFSAWLVKDKRSAHDVLKHLSCLNAETDRRRKRRSITEEEFGKLLAVTKASDGGFRGLSGYDRFMLYTVAGYTGLRCSELASVKPISFDVDVCTPTVTVLAGYSKRRRNDVLPAS